MSDKKYNYPKSGSKRWEALQRITKEEFSKVYLYNTLDKTAEFFNIDPTTATYLKNYFNIYKTKEQKRISLENRYGSVETYYKLKDELAKKTQIDKYGSLENFSKYLGERIKTGRLNKYGSSAEYSKIMTTHLQETLLEKYGVTNISQLDVIKKKKKDTLIKNYGSVEDAYKIRQLKTNETLIKKYGSLENYREEQQKLASKTCMKNFGVTNPLSSPQIQTKIQNTIKTKYGVNYACQLPQVRCNGKHNSKPNTNFELKLSEFGLSYTREFPLDTFLYDFKINNILIEINPYATHNCSWSPFVNRPIIDKYYHQTKSKAAVKNGFICIHIWDWTDIDSVVANLVNNNYANKTQKFIEPQKYIYDYKLKKLMETETEHTVIIYDDGSVIE